MITSQRENSREAEFLIIQHAEIEYIQIFFSSYEGHLQTTGLKKAKVAESNMWLQPFSLFFLFIFLLAHKYPS